MDLSRPFSALADRRPGARPSAPGELWRALNAARPVDGVAVRYASLALLAFYVAAGLLRPMPGQGLAIWVRGAMCAYIAIGVLAGPRFTWRALRLFTVGLALTLNFSTASLVLLRGPIPGDLAVLALVIFAPTVFLQTATDVLVVVVALAAGATGMLSLSPVPTTTPTAAIVIFGALLTGGLTALVLIIFRDRISVSTDWWQDACARERALREFAEGAAPQLGEGVVARELATRLHHAFATGHCGLVALDAGDGPRVLATAGRWSEAAPTDAALRAMLGPLADRQPRLRSRVGDEALPWATAGGTWVALPVVLDDVVAGAVVLSAPTERPVGDEELLLWRAMANQVGAALESARLFARLQEALRARSEFVNTMSHELRSPLHVILGYAEMIADGRGDPAAAAGRIRANALELLQLVENTLVVARLGGGRLTVQASEFELQALFDELRESVAALPEAGAGAQIEWRIPRGLPPLYLDRLKVKEIVHNLVSNALKFAAGAPIEVAATHDAERLRLEIRDAGPGISAADQARIFDLFERGDARTAAGASGAGLGLYIVRSLTHLMGGEIALESAPGRGAQFTVWLPIRIEDR